MEMSLNGWGRRTMGGRTEAQDPGGRVTGAAPDRPSRPLWRGVKIGVMKKPQFSSQPLTGLHVSLKRLV